MDYDGTLVGIKKLPGEAVPTERLKKIIDKMMSSKRIDVFIVTGRSLEDIMSFFDNIDGERINWIGSHGAEIKMKGSKKKVLESAKRGMDAIKEIRSDIENMLSEIPCFIMEDKRVSFSIHFRNCEPENLDIIDEIKEKLDRYTKKFDIDYMEMKKVIEVKSKGIDKGSAIKTILDRENKKHFLSVCIGDDVTDEYSFEANSQGINIKVTDDSKVETKATYYLKDPDEVLGLLDLLS